MERLPQWLCGRGGPDALLGRIVEGAAWTLGLRIFTTGVAFLVSLLLARLLGAGGYGAYTYAISWVGLLSVPAVLGLDQLLTRNIAAYQTQGAWCLMKGLLRRAHQAALVASLGVAALAAVASWTVVPPGGSAVVATFRVGLILLPCIGLMRVRQAAMQGLRHVVMAQLPELLIQPVAFMALVGGVYFLLGETFTPAEAMQMNVGTACIACIVGARMLQKALPKSAKEASPTYETGGWLRNGLSLLCISGLYVINSRADTLMLGAMKGAEAVGVYAVATRGAELITFPLMAINAALAPTIASLYAAGDMKRLQGVVTASARATMLVAFPVAVALIGRGRWLLWLFGPAFAQGQGALGILSGGQLINVAMGSVGLLLIMTGHERDAALGVGISAIINVSLNAVLIPAWGLDGAAVATTSSLIIWNVVLAIWVYRRLGIHSTALGRIRLRETI